ncbi:MAG: transposase, partial [Pseudonocardiaceae bacterium]
MAVFAPCFTAPTFRTFGALVAGLVAHTGPRTVCGMLVGAGLSRVWAHDRAHRFFSAACWSPDRLGLALTRLVASLLVPAGAPVCVVIDDTLFKRSGRRVWAASWFHDGSATGPKKVGFGNNWVIAGIIVTLPFLGRPVCLPVAARLVVGEHHLVVAAVAGRPPGRRPGPRAARPGDSRGRRRRLRRRRAAGPARPGHLDHPAAPRRRPVRARATPDRQTRPRRTGAPGRG